MPASADMTDYPALPMNSELLSEKPRWPHKHEENIIFITSMHNEISQNHQMNHIVDTCPLTNFEGGLYLLHKTDMAGIYIDCSTRNNNNNNDDRLTAFDPGQPG